MTTTTVEGSAGSSRLLTIPNVISIVRLCCLPLFLYLLLGRDDEAWAGWLLAALGASDWVDGYIARRFHQVSELGKVLDPVADRLLFFVGVGAILYHGSAPLWVGALVLVREALVAGATMTLAAAGSKRIDVTWFGKAGTFALMFAFPLFLAGDSDMFWAAQGEFLAWCFTIPGLILSYIAAAMYVPIGLRALREGRAGRVTQGGTTR